mmetsp:Transcript_25092/g.54585  ORF Transcript_25092/g.54585 Transcript_25092/m.54585 type:complete len:198 (-) Transcript_25092:375-968(-)|eukprot:CAMPEP_0118925184 /NCGR_PEP_ID=MMETSP1169-20130426/3101_1 /TAXON_ID=36882 /ORGANISM="Pyramimonas obovata, Strain CCMP722" /LENGTH=197 /DNA_ID=CAMNT_0006866409 /DNA_START=32 /DNA_END=625 /DNA_ORIENTATION=+
MASTIVSSSCAIRPVARVSSPSQPKAMTRGLSSVRAVSNAVVFLGKQQMARANARSGFTVFAEEAAAAAAPAKKAPKKKKKKAPALPLPQDMEENIIPGIAKNLNEAGVADLELIFEDNQLRGSFKNASVPYNFWAYFPDGSLTGQRGWSFSSHGYPPSTVEPFIIDEKRIDATTVIFWVTKRLEATKSAIPGTEEY